MRLLEHRGVSDALLQGQTTGFTLDSLLKLNTAKAFDKKTSILHYLVMIARRNDPTLLDFKDVSAEGVMSSRGLAGCPLVSVCPALAPLSPYRPRCSGHQSEAR